jgi:pyridinium-3,5-biscarboxylic acid mononucleotide synthase
MDVESIKVLLRSVAEGATGVEDALSRLRRLPFESFDHATVDHHRALRCGTGEVIFCQGKSIAQVVEIARRLSQNGSSVLATRASPEQLSAMREAFAFIEINELARAALIHPPADVAGHARSVRVICAGTADTPIAEEAMMTLRSMCVPAELICDVGVAGLHRLLARLPELQQACAIVVIAGMEGALPSVVGGLVSCPVYAVPTSVGYGASFGGLSALLGMLNSCASNVSVVNIDNGFGAAHCAGLVFKQVTA